MEQLSALLEKANKDSKKKLTKDEQKECFAWEVH